MWNWLKLAEKRVTKPLNENRAPVAVFPELERNIQYIKAQLGGSFDILYKHTCIGNNRACLIMDDGMCDNLLVTQQVVAPIMQLQKAPDAPAAQMAYIRDQISAGIDQKEDHTLDEVLADIVSGVVVLLICAIMSTLSLFGFGTSFLVQLGASRRVAISVLYVRALMEWVAAVLGFVVMSGIETLALRLFLPQIETVWLALFVPIWVYPLVVGAMVIFFGFFGALMLRFGRGAYAVLYAVIVLPGLLSGPVTSIISNRTDTNFFTHLVLTAADFCAGMPAVGWSVLGTVVVIILLGWSITLLKRTGV